MAGIEYIGAKYIPTFAEPAQWTNDREYQPLTIVFNEGNSYTSKQRVPVGVDIKDAKFWQQSGNYNAQIELYRKEVEALDNKVTTYDERITNNTNKSTANETAITNETERAQGEETRIENLITSETERAQGEEAYLEGEIQRVEGTIQPAIDAKFPVDTANIADASITASKLTPSAIASVLEGLTIHYFDSKNPNADNEGMVIKENGPHWISGFYIEELMILVVNFFEVEVPERSGSYGDPLVTLPTYIPDPINKVQSSPCAYLKWTNSENFYNWTQMNYGPGRILAPQTSTNGSSENGSIMSSVVLYLRPFVVGTASSATYSDLKDNNATIA